MKVVVAGVCRSDAVGRQFSCDSEIKYVIRKY